MSWARSMPIKPIRFSPEQPPRRVVCKKLTPADPRPRSPSPGTKRGGSLSLPQNTSRGPLGPERPQVRGDHAHQPRLYSSEGPVLGRTRRWLGSGGCSCGAGGYIGRRNERTADLWLAFHTCQHFDGEGRGAATYNEAVRERYPLIRGRASFKRPSSQA